MGVFYEKTVKKVTGKIVPFLAAALMRSLSVLDVNE